MKKLIIILLAFFAVTACRPELNFLPDSFESKDAILVGDEDRVSLVFGSSKAGSARLSIQTNKQWTATFVNDRAREWCSLSEEGGKKGTFTLTVSVKENSTYDDREAAIVLQCKEVQRTIVVTQKQKDALLMSPSRVELPQEGGNFIIEVKTNVGYTLSIPSEVSQWVHWAETKALIPYKMTIEVDPNTDLNPRQAVLTVKSALGNEEVTIYQMGEDPALVISEREVEVPTVGGEFDVRITSNLDVEVELLPATCDWVEEVKTKTISTNTYSFTAAANDTEEPRKMSLVFKNAEYGLSDTLHVSQAFLPGFSYSTSKQEVKGPWLSEDVEEVTVFWGDGSFEPYAPNLVHRYAGPGSHTVQVEGNTLLPVRIPELEDGMVIDFSRIKKKEEAQ